MAKGVRSASIPTNDESPLANDVLQKVEEEQLDLSGFDYKNMKGNAFIEYAKFAAKLNWNKQYVFDVFKVDTIKQQRYKGVPGTPVDIIGFEIKSDKPIHTTKMEAKNANVLNGIVIDEDGYCVSGQFENTKRIYLLKK